MCIRDRTNFSPLGNFSREELEQALEGKFRLPSYLADVVAAYADPEGEEAERMDMTRPFERNLYESYYRACAASKCRFLREWSDFDRTLRNVCAAYSARRSGVAPETVVEFKLDEPFLFAITGADGLPLFAGIVNQVS